MFDTGSDIADKVNSDFQYSGLWNNCISVYTDGVAAVTGQFIRLLSAAKNEIYFQ